MTDGVQSAGQCIQYIKADGSIGRSTCIGFERGQRDAPPAWFSALGSWLLAARTRSAACRLSWEILRNAGRHDGDGRRSRRDLEGCLGAARPDRAGGRRDLPAAIHRDQPRPPSHEGYPGRTRYDWRAATCRAACRASGLSSFSASARSSTRWRQSLDRTTRERTALAARLVDGQEQERRHLARELHDELAQSLSAMSADRRLDQGDGGRPNAPPSCPRQATSRRVRWR